MSLDSTSAVRRPKAAFEGMAQPDYALLFRMHREVNDADVDLSYLALGLAAGELAIALTPREPDAEPASTLLSRLPEDEMSPEQIFEFLTDAEKKNLDRATTIVDLIRSSFAIKMNQERWSTHG